MNIDRSLTHSSRLFLLLSIEITWNIS